MPGGEGWQFVGTALGANPTPMAFTEVYTALQSGAIDGQDNPLTADKDMKFYEVTNQIVMTNHLVANNQFTISDSEMEQHGRHAAGESFRNAPRTSKRRSMNLPLKRESELVSFFKDKGLKVYSPDNEAFRKHVLEAYAKSPFSKDWPAGLVDKISAL